MLIETERSRRRLDELRATTEQQQQQIAELELALARSHRLLKQTRNRLVRIIREPGESPEERLQKLLETIDDGTEKATSRRTFDEWLDQSKRTFLRRLSARYPMLTPTELKICSLLQLNLRTREIAGLLQTSVRSVESHRYWIRKKLSIPSDVNLSTYLTGI